MPRLPKRNYPMPEVGGRFVFAGAFRVFVDKAIHSERIWKAVHGRSYSEIGLDEGKLLGGHDQTPVNLAERKLDSLIGHRYHDS
jgi:hypothetical protein